MPVSDAVMKDLRALATDRVLTPLKDLFQLLDNFDQKTELAMSVASTAILVTVSLARAAMIAEEGPGAAEKYTVEDGIRHICKALPDLLMTSAPPGAIEAIERKVMDMTGHR